MTEPAAQPEPVDPGDEPGVDPQPDKPDEEDLDRVDMVDEQEVSELDEPSNGGGDQ